VQGTINGLTTSSIISNNLSSLTSQVSSLTALNISSVQGTINGLTTSSIISNNLSSLTSQVSSLSALNISSVQGTINGLTTSSIVTNNMSSIGGQLGGLTMTSYPVYSWNTTTASDAITTARVSGFNVGSSNFTMECFFNPIATPATYGTIMGIGTTATQGHEFRISQRIGSDGIGFIYPTSASTDLSASLSATSTLSLNTWYHLAFVRSTNWAYLYSNGTAILSTNAISHSLNETKQLFLFSNPYNDLTGQGYINSARMVVGQALYTGNFTPPTQQLNTTNIGTSGPNVVTSITGTIAFLGGVTNTFRDVGPSALTLTTSGSPATSSNVPATFSPYIIGINCNSPQYAVDINGVMNVNKTFNATALTTSSIVSNNLSSLTGQISSLITLNVSSLGGQVGALTTSSIVSNNLSSLTGQISSLITLNVSSLRGQVGALTTSSIISNNLSSITGQISSLITLNVSSLRGQMGGLTISSLGINCNAPQYALDVNGTVNLNDNLSFAGTTIPNLGGNYSALGLLGGNSYGYLYGAYNSLGDGIHLSYNYISCNLAAPSTTTAYIPNIGGTTSQLDIGYGSIQFSIGATNTAPTSKMYLNGTGLGLNCNSPAYMLDVNGTTKLNGAVTMPSLPTNNVLITSAQQQILLSNAASAYMYMQAPGNRIRVGAYSNIGGMSFTINESGGNVGINCNAPQYQLDVNGTIGITASNAILINSSNLAGKIVNTYILRASPTTDVASVAYASTLQLLMYNEYLTSFRSILTVAPDTNIGIGCNTPTYNLDLVGNMHVSGQYYTNSDQRVKENIVSADLSICYSTMKGIDLKYFQWNSNFQSTSIIRDRHQLGFLAQEVQHVFPNSVYTTSNYGYDDFCSIESGQLNAMHFGATQELMNRIDQQDSTIQGMRQETASTILEMQLQLSTFLSKI
jgi:hypothetical protein